jgi:hypothetical protein
MTRQKLTDEQDKLARLAASMSVDYLLGTGCTHGAYIMNLRHIADELEKIKPPEHIEPTTRKKPT